MKRILLHMMIVWTILLIVPLFCAFSMGLTSQKEISQIKADETGKKYDDVKIKVKHTDTGEVEEMPLCDYLINVVTAEMPASFERDALMAQAVAARSYTYNKYLKNQSSPGIFETHDGADVCTNFSHCKAYMTLSDAKEKWGQTWVDTYYEKICSAVRDTDGEILTYGSQPVNAVFHSASYGRTENAQDVWGGDVAYLKSVESPLGEAADSLVSKVTLPLEEFKSTILSEYPDAVFSDDKSTWVSDIVRSEGGSVSGIKIGGIDLKGTKVRTLFSLKSANFILTLSDSEASFEVYGSGHGVGLSQYGANALAKDGYTYREILSWYYKGTDISYWGKE